MEEFKVFVDREVKHTQDSSGPNLVTLQLNHNWIFPGKLTESGGSLYPELFIQGHMIRAWSSWQDWLIVFSPFNGELIECEQMYNLHRYKE